MMLQIESVNYVVTVRIRMSRANLVARSVSLVSTPWEMMKRISHPVKVIKCAGF